ncbi:UNVERIFIED_CONTAM: Glutamate decarboxylase 2 [Gekko kuhli]
MATPGSGFWSFGSEEGSGDPDNPGPARAWCQAAQKFTGGISTKLCALLYGDGEKPMETGAKEDPSAPPRKPTCTCNKKPCGCQKADMNYAFLHSSDVMDILLQHLVTNFDRSTKVIDFHYPNELLQDYNWELADQPQTLEEILLNCRTALKYAIKTDLGSLKETLGGDWSEKPRGMFILVLYWTNLNFTWCLLQIKVSHSVVADGDTTGCGEIAEGTRRAERIVSLPGLETCNISSSWDGGKRKTAEDELDARQGGLLLPSLVSLLGGIRVFSKKRLAKTWRA